MLLRTVFALALAAGVLEYVVLSWHAPMIWDTPVMRYVNFLMDHGMEPYRQIGDLNMPGAYLSERWAMAIFGAGDLGSRLYEFFELAVLVAASILIAGRRLWFGGLYAGGFFVLMHASEGPLLATERDELVMVLIVAGYALLFESMRRGWPLLMALFGAALGMAASIKPTVAPLELLLLVMLVIEMRRRGQRWLPYLLWAVLGTAILAGVMLGFLLRHDALGAFIALVRTVLPSYAALNHPGWMEMVLGVAPATVLLVLPLGIAAMAATRAWDSWEDRALALGALAGIFSYFIQGKGFVYHRYLFLMFVLLCVGKAFAAAMRREEQKTRMIGALGVLATLLLVLPYYAFLIPFAQKAGTRVNQLSVGLQGDLIRLGGDKLQGQVQCFDMVGGCLNALYHLRLVQRLGTTGDMLYFSPVAGPEVRSARKAYWDATRNAPPEVIVLGNEWFQGAQNGFDKIDTWPEFAKNLQTNYELVLTRRFAPSKSKRGTAADVAPAYRIYLLRGSALAQRK
ncbi:MAG: hypothetical protein ACYCSN_02755 [Acidobacteriaceae bacterium]